MGFQEVDNKARRHCGDRGVEGSGNAKLTRRSKGQGTLASECFSNVFFRLHATGMSPPWKDQAMTRSRLLVSFQFQGVGEACRLVGIPANTYNSRDSYDPQLSNELYHGE